MRFSSCMSKVVLLFCFVSGILSVTSTILQLNPLSYTVAVGVCNGERCREGRDVLHVKSSSFRVHTAELRVSATTHITSHTSHHTHHTPHHTHHTTPHTVVGPASRCQCTTRFTAIPTTSHYVLTHKCLPLSLPLPLPLSLPPSDQSQRHCSNWNSSS